MPDLEFHELELPPALLTNLDSLGYRKMMPVQAASLPAMLAGRDVIAQAKTGSGKTAAFGLSLLAKLQPANFRVQALVLCPTRELADQVAKEIRALARTTNNVKVLTLCGGMPIGPQLASLQHGAHVVVGTPGRVDDLLRRGKLRLDATRTLVLDEADRMLDMGFQAAIDAIVGMVPQDRQTLLFSATYPSTIKSIASRIMRDPTMVEVESSHDERSIQEYFYRLPEGLPRPRALARLLRHFSLPSAVVFCATKRETQALADSLNHAGFSALAIHGDLEQRDRDKTLVRFANGSVSVLVATDVAARGLDISDLGGVFNYHLSRDCEVHVHRIGRTGRAGQSGIACSLVADKEMAKLERLSAYLGKALPCMKLPSEQETSAPPPVPRMITLEIAGGKKQKIRPGDILGALTGDGGVLADEVGKISIFQQVAYVAVDRKSASRAVAKLREGKLKGKRFRVRRLVDSPHPTRAADERGQ